MGLFYIVMDQPVEKIKQKMEPNITGTQYENDYKKMNTMWDYFLLIFLLAICCYGVILAMTRES